MGRGLPLERQTNQQPAGLAASQDVQIFPSCAYLGPVVRGGGGGHPPAGGHPPRKGLRGKSAARADGVAAATRPRDDPAQSRQQEIHAGLRVLGLVGEHAEPVDARDDVAAAIFALEERHAVDPHAGGRHGP